MKKLKILIFTGGSANLELIKSLNLMPHIKLTLLINGYDDGKSTKFVREIAGNMLGPSDFRKNILNLLDSKHFFFKHYEKILNLRFKNYNHFKDFYKNIDKIKKSNNEFITNLNKTKFDFILNSLKNLDYKKLNNKKFKDISLANLFFLGIFNKNKNFNRSVELYKKFFNIKNEILNISNGENLYLHALCSDGTIINNEEEIVLNKKKKTINNIFLLKKKHIPNNQKIEYKSNYNYLSKNSISPKPNLEAIKKIKEADIIIYGPGTQFSSLFPSYLTKNITETLSKSKAKKILILNIYKDNDIINENRNSLIAKVNYFLSFKTKEITKIKKMYNYIFLNKYDEDDINKESKNYLENTDFKTHAKCIYLDWEKNEGTHLPNLLIKNILRISKRNFIPFNILTFSIIIPCLNEEKNLDKVLSKLKYFGHPCEFIFVDGGSNDKSLEIAKKYKFLKIYSLKNKKRGHCIDYAITKSKGEKIAIFPSDNEYLFDDLIKISKLSIDYEYSAVFGSRLIKCINLDKQISKIYGKNTFNHFLSKYGGLLISLFTLLLYNRFITDPLSSIKVYNANLIKKFNIRSYGYDYDIDLYTQIIKNKKYIHEYPVSYKGRNYQQGKKIKIMDGLSCLFTLLRNKLW